MFMYMRLYLSGKGTQLCLKMGYGGDRPGGGGGGAGTLIFSYIRRLIFGGLKISIFIIFGVFI